MAKFFAWMQEFVFTMNSDQTLETILVYQHFILKFSGCRESPAFEGNIIEATVKWLSIGTPENNKISICSKCKYDF